MLLEGYSRAELRPCNRIAKGVQELSVEIYADKKFGAAIWSDIISKEALQQGLARLGSLSLADGATLRASVSETIEYLEVYAVVSSVPELHKFQECLINHSQHPLTL
jgi:hypothetical protein